MLSILAAPSKLKWNGINPTLLLSAHSGEIRVWDIRKYDIPMESIVAHVYPITGIEWNIKRENEFLTCSQDKKVKFWRLNRSNQCKDILHTGAPILTSKYTPFGHAVITATRFDHKFKLWNTTNLIKPLRIYEGPKDTTIGFSWRLEGLLEEEHKHQLISLSKDRHIYIWDIHLSTEKACSTILNNSSTPKGFLRISKDFKPLDLSQEFCSIRKKGDYWRGDTRVESQ